MLFATRIGYRSFEDFIKSRDRGVFIKDSETGVEKFYKDSDVIRIPDTSVNCLRYVHQEDKITYRDTSYFELVNQEKFCDPKTKLLRKVVCIKDEYNCVLSLITTLPGVVEIDPATFCSGLRPYSVLKGSKRYSLTFQRKILIDRNAFYWLDYKRATDLFTRCTLDFNKVTDFDFLYDLVRGIPVTASFDTHGGFFTKPMWVSCDAGIFKWMSLVANRDIVFNRLIRSSRFLSDYVAFSEKELMRYTRKYFSDLSVDAVSQTFSDVDGKFSKKDLNDRMYSSMHSRISDTWCLAEIEGYAFSFIIKRFRPSFILAFMYLLWVTYDDVTMDSEDEKLFESVKQIVDIVNKRVEAI